MPHPDRSVRRLRIVFVATAMAILTLCAQLEREWRVFETAMRKVLPGARVGRLTPADPIFHSFFSIESLDILYPDGSGRTASWVSSTGYSRAMIPRSG